MPVRIDDLITRSTATLHRYSGLLRRRRPQASFGCRTLDASLFAGLPTVASLAASGNRPDGAATRHAHTDVVARAADQLFQQFSGDNGLPSRSHLPAAFAAQFNDVVSLAVELEDTVGRDATLLAGSSASSGGGVGGSVNQRRVQGATVDVPFSRALQHLFPLRRERKEAQLRRVACLVRALRQRSRAVDVVDVGGGKGVLGELLSRDFGIPTVVVDRNARLRDVAVAARHREASDADAKNAAGNGTERRADDARRLPGPSNAHQRGVDLRRRNEPRSFQRRVDAARAADAAPLLRRVAREIDVHGVARLQSSQQDGACVPAELIARCFGRAAASSPRDVDAFSVVNKPSCLVGVHACGSLSDAVVAAAASVSAVRALIVVPCCHQRKVLLPSWNAELPEPVSSARGDVLRGVAFSHAGRAAGLGELLTRDALSVANMGAGLGAARFAVWLRGYVFSSLLDTLERSNVALYRRAVGSCVAGSEKCGVGTSGNSGGDDDDASIAQRDAASSFSAAAVARLRAHGIAGAELGRARRLYHAVNWLNRQIVRRDSAAATAAGGEAATGRGSCECPQCAAAAAADDDDDGEDDVTAHGTWGSGGLAASRADADGLAQVASLPFASFLRAAGAVPMGNGDASASRWCAVAAAAAAGVAAANADVDADLNAFADAHVDEAVRRAATRCAGVVVGGVLERTLLLDRAAHLVECGAAWDELWCGAVFPEAATARRFAIWGAKRERNTLIAC
jgi:hypothetical protein